MLKSNFGAHKPLELDKKRFANIHVYDPKSIVNQYFGFSLTVRFEKARHSVPEWI